MLSKLQVHGRFALGVMSWDLMDKLLFVKEKEEKEDLGGISGAIIEKAEPCTLTGLEPWPWKKGWNKHGVQGRSWQEMAKKLVPCSDWDLLKARESHGRFWHDKADFVQFGELAGIIAVSEGCEGLCQPDSGHLSYFCRPLCQQVESKCDILKRCPFCSFYHVLYIKHLETGVSSKLSRCEWRFLRLGYLESCPDMSGDS